MIVNEIPTKIKIEVEDAESDTGLKEVETTVVCVLPILTQISELESNEVIVFVSYDKDGNTYGRPFDKVKIIETRKYEESKNRSTRNTPKKRRSPKRKSDKNRNNNPRNQAGNESDRKSSSDGEGDRE